jgi:hypothetical protein
MPWLRGDTNLAGATGHLAQWRREQAPPKEAFVIPRVGYGFEFIGPDYQAPVNNLPFKKITVKKGMHGLVLEIRQNEAHVRFLNLCWKNVPLTAIIPTARIRGGTKKYEGPNEWGISLDVKPPSSANIDLTPREYPTSSGGLLASAISTYLELVLRLAPRWLPEQYVDQVGLNGENIQDITQKLLRAVDKAGLLTSVFAKSDGFTVDDMVSNGQAITEENKDDWEGECIIYFILYEEDPDKSYLYVGKSRNVPSRLYQYRFDTTSPRSKSYNSKHMRLRRSANEIHMCALCIFDSQEEYTELHGIAEQVFTSLLETYRKAILAAGRSSTILDRMSSEVGNIKRNWSMDVEHCVFFQQITQLTLQKTGFQGGVLSSEAFGVDEGMNWKSPLPEAASFFNCEPILYLREDAFDIDATTGDTYPVANFRRSKKLLNHWGRQTGDIAVAGWYRTGSSKEHQLAIVLKAPVKFSDIDSLDDTELPAQNALVWTTFEARLDWKPHEKGYARLPEIAPYNDWDRANGWAFRIDWTDSKGQPRRRYIQAGQASMRTSESAPAGTLGASTHYANGIAMSHWLFGDSRVSNQPWVFRIPTIMNVRTIVRNCLDWTIMIKTPQRGDTGPIRPPNGNLKPEGTRLTEMINLSGNYLVVDPTGDTTVAPSRPGGWGKKRTKCDACYMAGYKNCERKGTKKVCRGCEEVFGRPRCTYTQGVLNGTRPQTPGQNDQATWKALVEENDLLNQKRRRLLLDQCPLKYLEDTASTYHTTYITAQSTMTSADRRQLEDIAEAEANTEEY